MLAFVLQTYPIGAVFTISFLNKRPIRLQVSLVISLIWLQQKEYDLI